MIDLQSQSAKIYAFPARTQHASRRVAEQATVAVVADLASRRLPTVAFGSGWYHDSAIEQAGRDQR